uniref:RING-type domain-containing protein n=1 Tax=Ananas comosus var. bracteatus TaxID=296719 RepID=A0A6V7PJP9_ANACO|nr:unnamed protein product [Ananas comosus var. bracteatus]
MITIVLLCYPPKPLTLTIQLLDYIRLSILLSLSYLGLAAAPFEEHTHPTSPSPIAPSAIEARLRVVAFASFARRSAKGEESIVCAVCLGDLELEHEVRELGNCSHAFHKGCIDKWVEIGHATCPLCRALLWPIEWGEN